MLTNNMNPIMFPAMSSVISIHASQPTTTSMVLPSPPMNSAAAPAASNYITFVETLQRTQHQFMQLVQQSQQLFPLLTTQAPITTTQTLTDLTMAQENQPAIYTPTQSQVNSLPTFDELLRFQPASLTGFSSLASTTTTLVSENTTIPTTTRISLSEQQAISTSTHKPITAAAHSAKRVTPFTHAPTIIYDVMVKPRCHYRKVATINNNNNSSKNNSNVKNIAASIPIISSVAKKFKGIDLLPSPTKFKSEKININPHITIHTNSSQRIPTPLENNNTNPKCGYAAISTHANSIEQEQPSTDHIAATTTSTLFEMHMLAMTEKQQLLSQLNESEKALIYSMKQAKKFNFSKNVIKQFLKVINSQITYTYKPSRDSYRSATSFPSSQSITTSSSQSGSPNNATSSSLNHATTASGNSNSNNKSNNNSNESGTFTSYFCMDPNPQPEDLMQLRHAISQFLKKNSFTQASIKRVMSHPYYSLYFRDFLDNYTISWIELGKTKYKDQQRVMIEFLKLCMRDTRLLVFLSGMHIKSQSKNCVLDE